MTQFRKDDLAVIRGPLVWGSGEEISNLYLGEVVEIVETQDEDGDLWVFGRDSQRFQYIHVDSLISWAELLEDGSIIWGEDGDLIIEFDGAVL